MGLALLEYAEGLQLRDGVLAAPALGALRQTTLDLVIWMHVRPSRPRDATPRQ